MARVMDIADQKEEVVDITVVEIPVAANRMADGVSN